jgi:Skp family chaperone for outer membrane proteins
MFVTVRRLVSSFALVFLAASTTAVAQQPAGSAAPALPAGRIAFINAQAILRGMPGYAKAESAWVKEANAAQIEGQKLQAAFDSTVETYRQSQAMLSPSARTAREKVLAAQQDSLNAKLQSIQERVAGRERELLTPMQQRLTAIIDGMRAENNYWLVIDLGGNAGQFIVSYDKSLDITDKVVRRLLQSN